METKKEELIVVKQLPIIEERLKSLSDEIDVKVANAMELVVSDETIKEVKKVRAELNKDFTELETQRKMVKERVLAPYEAFEEIYKKYVSEKFKDADKNLKIKIDSVETAQKEAKEKEVKEYYSEYAISENVEWLNNSHYYQLANINITLSASMKSLKESAKGFIDKVIDDIKLIETQEHKEEIFVEYQKELNVSKAITEVTERYKKLEKMEEKKIQEAEINRLQEINEKKIKEVAPVTIEEVKEEKVFELNFKVFGTKEKLLELKSFLDNGGYKYEC
jgi:hypothetical protein